MELGIALDDRVLSRVFVLDAELLFSHGLPALVADYLQRSQSDQNAFGGTILLPTVPAETKSTANGSAAHTSGRRFGDGKHFEIPIVL